MTNTTTTNTTTIKFADLGLDANLLKALAAEGYESPTPIQAKAIPLVLEGYDMLGTAQTGTGKTAAFALPILQNLALAGQKPQASGVRALVLSPTRELASQIEASFRAYGRFQKLSSYVVFGGVPINRQRHALLRGVDILVATPGRLLDLVEQRMLRLDGVEILVLDEADQMLDLGFIHDLRRISKLVPKERQTLFFSATMPPAIRELASQFLSAPREVSVAPVSSTVDKVTQQVVFVQQAQKPALLAQMLADESFERVIVFARTKHGADRIVRGLEVNDIPAAAIHGNKSQNHRERALRAFRDGNCRVLVATDIAARGIDIDGISHVVNFDLPNVPETYVHRIGRTARAGATGLAISFCAGDERSYLKSIERLTKKPITVLGLSVDPERAVVAPPPAPRQPPARPQTHRQGQPGQHRRPAPAPRHHSGRPHGENAPHAVGGEAAARPARPQHAGNAAHHGGEPRPARQGFNSKGPRWGNKRRDGNRG